VSVGVGTLRDLLGEQREKRVRGPTETVAADGGQ
jgi:hypothetical protein